MPLVDRECARRLLESDDPDVALVFVRGECLVLPVDEIDDEHRGLVIIRRSDLPDDLVGAPISDDRVEALACRLDNAARDLGG
ncbi:hypothetical protein [Sphaerimonospora mesophila]|uniref:hypothetical protein n=1 Tax=Sphaerimonospora mesophila TaxID=37483 RepID=UPI0006E123C1